MKNKKIAILLSMTMLVPSFSFADTFSYESAVSTAIKNNLKLERAGDTIDDINDRVYNGDSNTDSSAIHNSITFDNLLSRQKIAKIDYDAQKDAITINVKSLFIKIEYLEKTRELLKDKLANTAKKIAINRVRYKNGVISKIDYNNSELELEKVKNAQKENELNIKMAYKGLQNVINSNKVTNISYIDDKYTPVNTLSISKEQMIGTAIANSSSIISQNQDIKMLEEQIKYGLLDYSNNTLPSEEISTKIAIKDVDIRITKQNIENAVIETANSLDNIELNIKNMKEELQNLQNEQKNLQNKVRLGTAKKQDLADVSLSIKELDIQLENAISEHQILLEKYQKPYLLSI